MVLLVFVAGCVGIALLSSFNTCVGFIFSIDDEEIYVFPDGFCSAAILAFLECCYVGSNFVEHPLHHLHISGVADITDPFKCNMRIAICLWNVFHSCPFVAFSSTVLMDLFLIMLILWSALMIRLVWSNTLVSPVHYLLSWYLRAQAFKMPLHILVSCSVNSNFCHCVVLVVIKWMPVNDAHVVK